MVLRVSLMVLSMASRKLSAFTPLLLCLREWWLHCSRSCKRITAALPYVEQAMTNLANVVQQKGNEMIDYGADVANGFVDNMVNTFDAKWNEIDNGLKSDFIGTIKGMIDAVKKGDIQTVAENTAAIIWKAMGEENRKQVKSYASDLVSNLTSALKTVGSKVFSSAKLVGKNILDGITSKFGEISTQVVGLGSKIASSFSSLIGPISASGKAISIGLSSGVLSQSRLSSLALLGLSVKLELHLWASCRRSAAS